MEDSGLTEHFEARKQFVSWLHRCAGGTYHCSICTATRFRISTSLSRLRCCTLCSQIQELRRRQQRATNDSATFCQRNALLCFIAKKCMF